MTTATFIEQALVHVEQDVPALKNMEDAITALTAAHGAVEPTQVGHAEYEDQIGSLLTLTQLARDTLRDRISGEALRAGRLLGREVVEYVRADGRNQPIVWLTGNSMFPPLRSYTAAERVFTLCDDIAWEQFCEGFDKALSDAQVFCACPDYDNALYAVDMLVWEHVEGADGDDLANEWRRIAPANPYSPGSELANIWVLGYDEVAISDNGRTYDDDPSSPRSVAYDEGKTAGERARDASIGKLGEWDNNA